MLFKKNDSIKERANAALANLQRNTHAMAMLRSRIESRITFSLSCKDKIDGCQELSRVLDLVENGELILHEMSEKIESARFLEEFVIIMDSAASSVSGIKEDLERMVPAAEVALEEINNTILKISPGLPTESGHDIEPTILTEIDATIPGSSANVTSTREAKEEVAQAQEERDSEPVPA